MTLRDAIPAGALRPDTAGDYWFDDEQTEFTRADTVPCVSPRLSLAVIRVTGADAATFLQAQLITNLRRLDRRHGSLSAWCTPQGRVSFQFHLLPADDGFALLGPASEAARLVQRLKMFVLRAQVIVEDISATHGVLGVSVPRARAAPPAVAGLVATRDAVSDAGDRLPALCIDASARYLVCGEISALAAWWRASGLPAIGSAAWRGLDIQQGHVDISGALANEFLPQQLNLDMIDALSFDKGCYPGQEIIARLKYRGEVKSRLMAGRAGGPLASGARLRTRATNHLAGQVVSAVARTPADCRFLAVVELGALQDVQVEDAPHLTLQFAPPPYWRV